MKPAIVAPWLIAVLLACPLAAQVFHKIEFKDVKARVDGKPVAETPRPSPVPPTKPDKTPDQTPKVDGQAALRFYNDKLKELRGSERDQRAAITKHTDKVHPAARGYLEGFCLARLGYYKEAEKVLKRVEVFKGDEATLPVAVRGTVKDIGKGKAYHWRMVSAVMSRWDNFRTDEEATAAWEKAAADATELVTELRKRGEKGEYADANTTAAEMNAWLVAARTQWATLSRAERAVQQNPESLAAWGLLAQLTGSRDNKLREDYSPDYLKQRAVLLTLIEFFKHETPVKDGTVSVALATNHVGVAQLDLWEAQLVMQEWHDEGARQTLNRGKLALHTAVSMIETLKTEK